MSTTWADIADMLESRGRRLGVPDDIGDLVLAAWGCLQGLVETYDLAAYTVHSEAILSTLTGERTYSLPDDFGRLLHPRDEFSQGVAGTGPSGLFLSDGTNRPSPLRYVEPVAFRQQETTTNGRPSTFTLTGRQIRLQPAPDANSGTPYVGQGVYIARVERPDLSLEDEVLLDEPMFLVSTTLFQIAADRGLPQAGSLEKEHMRQLSALVNNAARAKQKFYTQRWPMRAYR